MEPDLNTYYCPRKLNGLVQIKHKIIVLDFLKIPPYTQTTKYTGTENLAPKEIYF